MTPPFVERVEIPVRNGVDVPSPRPPDVARPRRGSSSSAAASPAARPPTTSPRLAQKDVLVLEQGKLTCGTTWHAAGLIGQMRPNRTMTADEQIRHRAVRDARGRDGLATGWKQCGSVNVAQTRERMMVLRKQPRCARSFGVECEEISPARAGELFPAAAHRRPRRRDLDSSGDGKANPADLAMSLAAARACAASDRRGCGSRRCSSEAGAGRAVTGAAFATAATRPRSPARSSSTAPASGRASSAPRRRQRAALVGGAFHIVTDRIDGVHPMLPVLRDPDGYIYYKEEVGGLLMGGFEPKAKPWKVDPIPSTFRFELLDEDWDQFEPLMTAAIRAHAVPRDRAGQDAAQRARELHARRQLHPRRGARAAPLLRRRRLQLGGDRQLGRRGEADRRVDRRGRAAQSDLADVDIRRFGAHSANKKALAERTGETLGLHYAMRWPRQELETARPLRTSPLHDLLARPGRDLRRARTAGSASATSAPTQRRSKRPTRTRSASRRGSTTWCASSARPGRRSRSTTRPSFGKLLLQGRDALAVLQRLCANEMDVAPGRIVYTPMLNQRGGFESDVTVTRLAVDRFLIVTGSAQAPRDHDWIARHIGAGEAAALVDVSAMSAGASADGAERAHAARPGRRERQLRRARPGAAEVLDHAQIDIGHARVRAARMSYVGGPGFTSSTCRSRWRATSTSRCTPRARGPRPLADAGYYALDAHRASKPGGAPGAPSSAPTRRRSRRGRCSRSSSPRPMISSASRRSCARRRSPCARSS